MRLVTLFIFIFFPSSSILSQSLSKAFKCLNAGNYEAAGSSLYEVLKKDPENFAAQYLMAKWYFMKDNPKNHLDSVNKYILKSATGFGKPVTEKDSVKYSSYGWRYYTVNELQHQINDEAFRRAESSNTSEAWNHFVANYTSSSKMKEAVSIRNQIVFNEALEKGDYTSFENFLEKYPDAAQVKDARYLFEKHLYQTKTADSTWQSYKQFFEKYPLSPYASQAKANYEILLYFDKTSDKNIDSYVSFVQNYPQSPYAQAAEDSIYFLSTRNHQLESYLSFITTYPSNHNVSKAWEQVYQIETPRYNYKTLKRFAEKYPFYPNTLQLVRDMHLSTRQYYSFQKNGLYGYIDASSRDTVIPARFTEAAPFSEGLAVVKLPCAAKKCPYAYVTMDGRLINKYQWGEASDFVDGHALAAIGNCSKDSCLYGFINRFGEWIVEPRYSGVYEYSEGLALVQNNHYGYIDAAGTVIIPLKYTNAGTFSEGLAAVQRGDSELYGFIDKNGHYVITPRFKKAGGFREGLAAASDENGLWGYVDKAGNWIIKPAYEFAMPFINGRARVVIKEKDKKNPKITTLRDLIIDKKGKVMKY